MRASVELGGLQPGDVTVQVVYGRVDESDELQAPAVAALQHMVR